MRRLVLGLALVAISALTGCQSPCCDCGPRHNRPIDPGRHAFGKGHLHGRGLHAYDPSAAHFRPPTEPAGGPVPQYAYPYYTLRGPRDFLVDNPPSIGPY